jgi:hypothetical protein
MHKHNVKRLFALGTASIKDSNDKFSLQFKALVTGVATVARNAYKDVVAIGETIRTKGADLEWTIVRVPLLNNKDEREVIAGYIGDGKVNTSLARVGFAVFVMKELESSQAEWVRKSPMICSS